MPKVEDLLGNDEWTLVETKTDIGPSLLRYREPILQSDETGSYSTAITVVWPYAPEDSGALPNPTEFEEITNYENELVTVLESDKIAVLVAVLTFDWARQWVFYTNNELESKRRILGIPHPKSAEPIELQFFSDPGWGYLRNKVIRDRG